MKLAIWAYSAAVVLALLAMIVLGALFQIYFEQLFGPKIPLPLITHYFVRLHWWFLLGSLPVLAGACFLTSARSLTPDRTLAFAGISTLIIVFLFTLALVSLLLPLLSTSFGLIPQ